MCNIWLGLSYILGKIEVDVCVWDDVSKLVSTYEESVYYTYMRYPGTSSNWMSSKWNDPSNDNKK